MEVIFADICVYDVYTSILHKQDSICFVVIISSILL